MSLLSDIQQNLQSPKGKTNTHGHYNFRNCEDILEALKPLLGDCSIVMTDDLIYIGSRYYVKATATLHSDKAPDISAIAWAREDDKGPNRNGAQETGCTSSYARKYALCGLFAIDSAKDPDSDKPPVKPKAKDPPERKKITDYFADKHGIDDNSKAFYIFLAKKFEAVTPTGINWKTIASVFKDHKDIEYYQQIVADYFQQSETKGQNK